MQAADEKAYLEQISSLNQLIVELQDEIYSKNQDIEIFENDLIEKDYETFKDYQVFFEQSPNTVVILDGFGKIKNANVAALDYFHKKKYDLVGASLRSLLDQVVFNEFTTQFHSFIKEKNSEKVVFHFLQQKNKKTFTLVLKKLLLSELKTNELIMGVVLPHDDDNQEQHSNYISHIVLDQLKDGLIITNDEGKIVKINTSFTAITGYTKNDVLGKNPSILKSGRHTHTFYKKMWYEIEHHGWWAGEIWNKRKNGEVYPEWLQINKVIEPATKRVFYTSLFSDISDRKKRQTELDRLAHYDTLTGLVNRYFLQITLTNLLENSKRTNTKNGILFLDLDHFKQINDLYGHNEGDLLLQEAAQRIQASVRTSDIVARVGGDEFIVVLTRVQSQELVEKISNNLIDVLRKPFHINNHEHTIGASIGIVISPIHGKSIDELLSRADSAMYRAKNSGRNQTSVFKQEDEEYIKKKDTLKSLLLKIIKEPDTKNLDVYYQPIINAKDNSLYSMEALLRVKDNDDNFINPEEIINIAESEGLISEFGEILFSKVCKFYKYNLDNNYKIVPITVNLSILQLIREDFIDNFKDIVNLYDLDISYFNFEITETKAMENLESLLLNIAKLNRLGSKIYLDDFGTGYASLSQLHNLPIDIVKIDKSFTFRIDDDVQAKNMVKAMVLMTNELGCKIVIEGVETKQSFEWLKSIGVDFIQGYYFSKPLNSKEIRKNYLT